LKTFCKCLRIRTMPTVTSIDLEPAADS